MSQFLCIAFNTDTAITSEALLFILNIMAFSLDLSAAGQIQSSSEGFVARERYIDDDDDGDDNDDNDDGYDDHEDCNDKALTRQ